MSEAPQTPGQLGHHVEGHVGYVTFNNPAKFNAVNYEMWCALPTAMQALADNPQVRLIVLQGAGEKAFVSGADISQFNTHRNGDARPAMTSRIAQALPKESNDYVEGKKAHECCG